jgi:hypothetical protein
MDNTNEMIVALQARIAALEARVALLEVNPYLYHPPPPYTPNPYWWPHYIVTNKDSTADEPQT